MATCGGVETIIFNCSTTSGEDTIMHFVLLGVEIFSIIMGVLAVIGITVCGIIWLTAGDNENKVIMAKKRMGQIVIGLICFVCLFGITEFLIPGTDTAMNDPEQSGGGDGSGGGGQSPTPGGYDENVTEGLTPTGDEGWLDRLTQQEEGAGV